MRKKRIINKKFQLGLAFQVIALSVISFSLFAYLALMLMNTSGNFVSTERAEMAEKALGTQEKIIKSFMEYSRRADSGDVAVATELVNSDHARSAAALRESLTLMKDSATNGNARGKCLMFAAAAVMFLNVVVLFVLLIKKTNAMCGPLYVMSRHMTDIKNKKTPEARRLRRGDEFTDFYNEFLETIDLVPVEKKANGGRSNGKRASGKKARTRGASKPAAPDGGAIVKQ